MFLQFSILWKKKRTPKPHKQKINILLFIMFYSNGIGIKAKIDRNILIEKKGKYLLLKLSQQHCLKLNRLLYIIYKHSICTLHIAHI